MKKNASTVSNFLAIAGIALSLSFGLPAQAVEVPWGPEQVVSSTADSARVAVPADVDGDGDLDLVISSLLDDTLAWYRNTDGEGSFALGQTITTTDGGAVTVATADLDHDGDLDLIAPLNDSVVWYENTDGLGTFVFNQNVAPVVSAPTSVFAADIDGDGDYDVVVAGQNDDTVSWWENDAQGAFTLGAILTTTADGAQSVFAADVDRDGDLDVLAASSNDNTVSWFDNTNGLGTSWTANPITTTANGATAVFAADIDRDGDLDVFSTAQADDTIMWHENTDGLGTFVLGQAITTTADGVRSLFAADIDGDGDPDVVSSSIGDDTIAWYENTDGAGAFGSILTITSAANAAFSAIAGDIDGDGDLDVVAASFNDDTIAWFENETIHSTGAWSPAEAFAFQFDAPDPRSAVAADVDGDGDLDAVTASSSGTAWYPNTDGRGDFGAQQIIDATSPDPTIAADMDGDGDVDVVTSGSVGSRPSAWYENTDGLGSFGSQQIIDAAGGLRIVAADLDGDGDTDVLTASPSLGWYENLDGSGSFGSLQTIDPSPGLATFAGDIDGDDDLDVISGFSSGGPLAWYENTDGMGTFGVQQIVDGAPSFPSFVFGADVDGDRDLDLFAANSWYENTDGVGTFGPAQFIGSIKFLSDVDGDSDIDAVSTSVWYENTDGLGSFSLAKTFGQQPGAIAGFVADVDADGDADLLLAYNFSDPNHLDEISWYENTDGRGNFVGETISSYDQSDPFGLASADIDLDGDLDVFADLFWHENGNGRGTAWVRRSSENLYGRLFAADIDRDGDTDLLSNGFFTDDLGWNANSGAFPYFAPFTLQTIASSVLTLQVQAADIDGDGDSDVLGPSDVSDIAWYENTDGLGSFAAAQSIAADGSGLQSADIDGDSDIDVISGNSWYENTDGLGNFGPPQSISASGFSALAADLDGDGDIDVMGTDSWFENTDGLGTFAVEQTVPGLSGLPAASDVDGDGDLDVVSTSGDWHENTDGLGTFGPAQTVASAQTSGSIAADIDLDGDGRGDVVFNNFEQDRILWKKNRSGQASFHSVTLDSGIHLAGSTVELLSVDLNHLGRAGDADLDLATLELLFDRAASAPLMAKPVAPLTSTEANALVEDLFVYRDDGSGVLEVGTDALITTISTLALTGGAQTVTLAGPDAQVSAGASGRFFVAAQLSTTPGPAVKFTVLHRSSRAEVHHAGTTIGISLAPGSGTQPLPILWLDPTADDDLDGLSNSDEVNVYGTDPLVADTDHDGLSDGDELNIHGTEPLVFDSDGDGLSDGDEVNVHGSNPNLTDTDSDGLTDGDEVNTHSTNPTLADTDGDGLSDGDEVNTYLTDPLADGDSDGDGISDADEIAGSLNPNSNDTDSDGFLDGLDNCPSAYNPFQLDRGGFGTAVPDGVGDVCQNGDFNGDGVVDILDITLQRRGLADLEPNLDPSMPPMQPVQ